jgi:Family of unknown function (DUF6496)
VEPQAVPAVFEGGCSAEFFHEALFQFGIERCQGRPKKRGTLKSGSGKKVKSRRQAIAIGLSEARRIGKKVPSKKKK